MLVIIIIIFLMVIIIITNSISMLYDILGHIIWNRMIKHILLKHVPNCRKCSLKFCCI